MPATTAVFAEPPTLVHAPSGASFWLTSPPGLVTHVPPGTYGDTDLANFMAQTVSERLLALPRETGQRLIIVHEWSGLSGYSTEARKIMTDWGLRIRDQIQAIYVVLPPDTNPLIRMGVSVATVTLNLADITLETVDDADEAIKRLELVARRDAHPRA